MESGSLKAGAEPGMKKAVLRGAFWIMFCYGLMIVLRFISNLILTWYLAPRILGVMALVNLLVTGFHLFSDLGIRQCVIHSPQGDAPDFLRTAWTVQVMRGLFLWFCSGLLAWPLAWLYGEPALVWLLPTIGVTSMLDGFNSTSVLTLSRRLHRGRLVLLEVGPYVASMTLTIGCVWWLARCLPPSASENGTLQTYQLMALAAGTLCAGLCETVISHLLQPRFRHRFCLDKEARSQLLHFGGWIFISTACTFLAAQADRLVVGKISLDLLGVYHIAAQLVAVPMLLMTTLGYQLVFPLYSRALHAGHDLRAIYARVHPLFTGFAALLATGLASAGPTLVRCLYPTRYGSAAGYIPLLTVGAWFTMLQITREMMLPATGRTRAMATGQAVRLLSLPPLLLAGFHFAGLTGMILGFAASEFTRYLVNVWLAREQRLSLLLNDIPLSLLIVGISLASARVGPLLWGEAPRFARFVAEGVFVVTAWAVVLVVWGSRRRQLFNEFLRRGAKEARP